MRSAAACGCDVLNMMKGIIVVDVAAKVFAALLTFDGFTQVRSELRRDVFCTSEMFDVHCSHGQVVIVRRAFYGRLDASRCITAEYTHAMGCYADVTTYIQDTCSGRQNCSVLVATIDALAQPCGKDFKSYLDIDHECVSASFVDDCRNGSQTVLLKSSGYLALYPNNWNRDPTSSLSLSAESAAAASFSPCPWMLVAEPGERFNVTWRLPSIFHQDFQEYPDQPSSSSSSSSSSSVFQCSASWKFLDSGDETQYAACVSNLRKPKERSYISKTNRLEIHYTGSVITISGLFHKHPRLPVLHYTVFGCKNFNAPEGAFVSRHLDNIAVVCNASAESWYLSCRDGHWHGLLGNCTTKTGDSSMAGINLDAMPRKEMRLGKTGIVVAVVAGMILGTLIGTALLIILYQLKRIKRRHRSSARNSEKSGGINRDAIRLKYVRQNVPDDVVYPALLCDDRIPAAGGPTLFEGHHEHEAWRTRHLGGALGTIDDNVFDYEDATFCRSIRFLELSSGCVDDRADTVDQVFSREYGSDREVFETGTAGNLGRP